MLVNCVGAVATDPQSIQHRDSHRREKIAVRSAANLRFAEFETYLSRDSTRLFIQCDYCERALQRRPIDATGHEHFSSLIDWFQIRKNSLDLQRLGFSREANV